MQEFSPEVKNETERGQKQAGREGQAGPVPSWLRSEARGTVTVRAGEGTGREQLVQVFPQTQNSLACFSANDKNTQWGNVSEKQIHFLLASLARLHGAGTVMLLHSLGKGSALVRVPHSGQRTGISPGQQLQCLGKEDGERRGEQRKRSPLPGRNPS